MKKLFTVFLAILVICAMLAGCASNSGTDDSVSPSETSDAEPAENTAPEETDTDPAETGITEDMAYEGIGNFCRVAYGWQPGEDDSHVSGLAIGEETDSEYQLLYRSYTGAIMRFYVDKASGATRIVEYVPAINIESEAGTIDLYDYLGDELPEEPIIVPPEPEEDAPKTEGHYIFKPKVCSVYMEEVFGETMCETWYNLVDAVMAGEDTFACPDQYTYDWVMGQFPRRCFPLLPELIDYAWDRENSVVDGVASITYLVAPEEAAARIDEFAKLVEGILNEVLQDDYSDFEKALALYDYFSRTYVYDWETADLMHETAPDYTSPYRLLTTGTGICSEISPAYSYLLMQVGVEATTMMGDDHEWSYVRIGGSDYHIDPTFALGDPGTLSYFMMTDDQREITGYPRDEFVISSNYSHDHPHPDYAADDDTFAPIWDCYLEELLPDEDIIRCWYYGPGWETEYLDFDYTGY